MYIKAECKGCCKVDYYGIPEDMPVVLAKWNPVKHGDILPANAVYAESANGRHLVGNLYDIGEMIVCSSENDSLAGIIAYLPEFKYPGEKNE